MTSVGRNEPCPCGSGKKYKKCCLEKDRAAQYAMPAAAAASEADGEASDDAYEVEAAEPQAAAGKASESEDMEEPPRDHEPNTERRHFPEPPEDLPDLPPGQDRLVTEWWAATKPFFKKRDADAMLAHLTRFMDQHPDLVAHLELEHEYLFEMGAELGRRREWSRYAELLLRLRGQHPEAYARGFGYFDYDLILEQLVCGRTADVGLFFNFFNQYPESDIDNASRVIDLLAWAGAQDALLDFVKPLRVAPDDLGFSFDTDWLAFARYVPFLDARTDPDSAAQSIVATVEALGVENVPCLDVEAVKRELLLCRKPPAKWDFGACRKHTDVETFYHDVAWNFRGFLHDSQGLPWSKAHFLARRLKRYWLRRAEDGRPKDPFPFDPQLLEEYICRTCRDFFHINGVCAVSLIEATWHFADYLLTCESLGKQEHQRAHDLCRDLFQRCLPSLDSTDPVPRLMPEFPHLRTAASEPKR